MRNKNKIMAEACFDHHPNQKKASEYYMKCANEIKQYFLSKSIKMEPPKYDDTKSWAEKISRGLKLYKRKY